MKIKSSLIAGCIILAGVTPQASGQESGTPETQSPVRMKGRIAFASDRDGDFDIFLADTDGGRLRKITKNRISDLQPTWHPNGRVIVYVKEKRSGSDLYGRNVKSGRQWRVTRTPHRFEQDPQFSPDGKWLAFRQEGMGEDGSNLLVRDWKSGRNRTAAHEEENVENFDGAWSPDSHWLAWRWFGADEQSISRREWFREGEGRPETIATDTEGDFSYEGLTWAPGGNHVYVGLDHHASDLHSIEKIDVRTGDAETVVSGDPEVIPGNFSPDGRYMAFARHPGQHWEIWLLRRDGQVMRSAIKHARADAVDPDWAFKR